jgi:hypothetical protein
MGHKSRYRTIRLRAKVGLIPLNPPWKGGLFGLLQEVYFIEQTAISDRKAIIR